MLDFGRVVGLWTRKRYFGEMWSRGDEEELFDKHICRVVDGLWQRR